MPKSQKVRMVVENSQRRGRFDELLAALERERPNSYPDHFVEQPQQIDPKPEPVETIERNPRQIFISHAHQDAEFAQKLATDLRANGWQTWMAPDDIRPGEKWVEAINRGLSESSVFVLLLTPDAVDSRWVKSEMNVAIGMEHREELRLLPLNIKSADAPALWQAYQWIGFDGNYDASLTRLLNVLDPRKVTSTEPIKPKSPSGRNSQDETKEEVGSSPQRTFNERIKAMPAYWFYAGGGTVFLLILLMSFWPERDTGSVVAPTAVAEVSVVTTEGLEATNTSQTIPSGTPTNELAKFTPMVNPTETPTNTVTPSITPTPSRTPSPTATINPHIPPQEASFGDSWA